MGDHHWNQLLNKIGSAIAMLVGAIVLTMLAKQLPGIAADITNTAGESPKASENPPHPEPSGTFDGSAALIITGLVVGGVIILALVVFGLIQWSNRRRRTANLKAAREAEQHQATTELRKKWKSAHHAYTRARAAYDTYLLDLEDQLFKRPLLSDVNADTTRALLDAEPAAASAYMPDFHDDPDAVDAFCTAADRFTAAWSAADTAARQDQRTRNNNISPATRIKITRARKLLANALDAANETSRQAYLTKVENILTDLGQTPVIPLATMAATIAERRELAPTATPLQLPAPQ